MLSDWAHMLRSLVAQMAERVAAKWPDQEQDLLVECLKQYTAEQLQQAVGRVQSYVTIHFYNINGIDDSVSPWLAYCGLAVSRC